MAELYTDEFPELKSSTKEEKNDSMLELPGIQHSELKRSKVRPAQTAFLLNTDPRRPSHSFPNH